MPSGGVATVEKLKEPQANELPAHGGKAPLIEIKNGKIAFRQKAVDWSNRMSTLKALVAFNEYMEPLTTSLAVIPDEHLPLISKLTHESDKALPSLCKQLQKTLVRPSTSESQATDFVQVNSILPLPVLENAVHAVADRTNYGIDKAPAAFCLWRWEARNLESLPHDNDAMLNQLLERRAERIRAKQEVMAVFEALDPEGKNALLKGGKRKEKADEPTKVQEKRESSVPKADVGQNGQAESSSTLNGKTRVSRPKKVVDEEAAAKEIEKEQKKAAKTERENKEKDAKEKSAAKFAAFFKKPAISRTDTSSSVPEKAAAPPRQRDFDRYFHPFIVKKDITVAPINRFHANDRLKTRKEKERETDPEVIDLLDDETVIILDDDGDLQMSSPSRATAKMPSASATGFLAEFLSTVPTSRRLSAPIGRKRQPPYSVRPLVASLTEAEVNDDTKNVRRIQDTLKDRRKIPAKLLQFSENQRPAYYGTWTKPSAVVGPRTPFAKDVVALDYSYDSSDEWEGQEEAEGAEDLMAADGDSGDEEDEDEMSDSESDWIVGDDEVIEDGNSPQPEAIQADFSTIDADATPKKRRVKEKDGAVGSKKRKVLIGPLLPFMKGPCWESTIGECEYEPFLDMRIRLLNEAPFPLDPFTYVADTIRSADAPSTSAPLANNFAIPAIPPHISSKIPCPVTPAMMEAGDKDSQNETKPTTNKRPPLAFNFPADRMPDFLRVIDGSTKTKPGLIELLYDTFSAQVNNLRKSGIERKLPEVAVKQKKVWKVKDEAWVAAGVLRS